MCEKDKSMPLSSYKDLEVWRKSIVLVTEIYKATEKFPKSEIYGLSSQMRRAAISIPSNIAEGYKRKNIREYIQFLRIAEASAAELETQVIISNKIYSDIDFSTASALLIEIEKMLFIISKKLSSR